MTKVLYYASGIFTGPALVFMQSGLSDQAGWCAFFALLGFIGAAVVDFNSNYKYRYTHDN